MTFQSLCPVYPFPLTHHSLIARHSLGEGGTHYSLLLTHYSFTHLSPLTISPSHSSSNRNDLL